MQSGYLLLLSVPIFAALGGCSDQPVAAANGASSGSGGAGVAGSAGAGVAGSAGVAGRAGTGSAAGGGGLAGSNSAGVAGAASGGVAGGGAGGGVAGTGGQPVDTGPVKHRWLTSVAHPGPLAIITDAGAVEWSIDIADESNDAWVLPSGNILHAYRTGARELTPTKQVVWDYPAPAGSEIHGCQPLDNGNYLLGESHDGGLSYLREVDNTGAVKATVTVQADATLTAHQQFREVRKTTPGTYLVTYMGLGKARELDAQGKQLREFACGSFVATRLPDGNTLIACGDEHRVIEVDPQDKIVWEVDEKDVPGNVLGFAAGLQRLANGNTVIANWSGHGGDATQPQVFEITRDKKVVWEAKNPDLKLVSMVEILDPSALVGGKALR
jgi:hypothetical protein